MIRRAAFVSGCFGDSFGATRYGGKLNRGDNTVVVMQKVQTVDTNVASLDSFGPGLVSVSGVCLLLHFAPECRVGFGYS